jgi:formylglycine-generating enzyme required for sulfatase activity
MGSATAAVCILVKQRLFSDPPLFSEVNKMSRTVRWIACWQLLAVICVAESSLPAANPTADAKSEAEMKCYTEIITPNNVKFEMVPIKGGKFMMGSPPSEANRKDDEGPQHEVELDPFWMGKKEVTWDEYEIFSLLIDCQKRQAESLKPTPQDKLADALARPTGPYGDITFGMGQHGYPAIMMTHHAARIYCQWLSAKTGRYYRLPTEAEWEYACRAGTNSAYSFGDDSDQLDDHAWDFDNSEDKYQKVGAKKPNSWGLYDMHGNITEWCLDQYYPDYYKQFAGKTVKNPVAVPKEVYPNVVRGGSWDDDPDRLRSAARRSSQVEWKERDPQRPKSVWYHTDAMFSGFRIVRPLVEPSDAEKQGARVIYPGKS